MAKKCLRSVKPSRSRAACEAGVVCVQIPAILAIRIRSSDLTMILASTDNLRTISGSHFQIFKSHFYEYFKSYFLRVPLSYYVDW